MESIYSTNYVIKSGNKLASKKICSNYNFIHTLDRLIRDNNWDNLEAFRTISNGYTYNNILFLSSKVANNLYKLGIKLADRVIIHLGENIDFISDFMGGLQVGAIAIPIISSIEGDLLRTLVDTANPSLVISSDNIDGYQVKPIYDLISLESNYKISQRKENDFAFGVFTSGTTGKRKICYHTHGDINILNNSSGKVIGISKGDIYLSVSGLYLAYGLGNSLFFPLLNGACTFLSGLKYRITPEEALQYIKKYNISVFSAIPSYFSKMVALPDSGNISSLRIAVTGGEILNRTLEKELLKFLTTGLVNIFGTTEIGHAVIVNRCSEYKAHKTGRVIEPFEVRIIDRNGGIAGPNSDGILEIKSPTITTGIREYNETPTRMENSWYATGDAARMDNEGDIELLGRLEDSEIISEQNVYPAEVESVILEIPEIRETAVCGFTNDYQLRELIAFVVADKNFSELPQKLSDHLYKYLSEIKIPSKLILVDSLPYIFGGKLSRKELRASVSYNLSTDRTKVIPKKYKLLGNPPIKKSETYEKIITTTNT